jgi:PTK7 protein tyrosine kinase 7
VDEKLPDDVDDINGTLIFNNIVLDHKGKYTCAATNDDETIKASIEVGIMPRFEVAPQEHIDVVELQSVLLNCVGFGSPEPTIKWDYESTMIKPESDERFHIYDNGSLLLQEARQDDSGRYGCTIGNSAGLKRSESHVMVKCK